MIRDEKGWLEKHELTGKERKGQLKKIQLTQPTEGPDRE